MLLGSSSHSTPCRVIKDTGMRAVQVVDQASGGRGSEKVWRKLIEIRGRRQEPGYLGEIKWQAVQGAEKNEENKKC